MCVICDENIYLDYKKERTAIARKFIARSSVPDP